MLGSRSRRTSLDSSNLMTISQRLAASCQRKTTISSYDSGLTRSPEAAVGGISGSGLYTNVQSILSEMKSDVFDNRRQGS